MCIRDRLILTASDRLSILRPPDRNQGTPAPRSDPLLSNFQSNDTALPPGSGLILFLGGLASNCNFSNDQEIYLLESYFGKKIDSNILRQYNAMKCASLLRETMWSMVSEITSKIDFDQLNG